MTRSTKQFKSFLICINIAFTFVLSAGCARHIRLVVPDATPGARYTCHGKNDCQPATVDVPARLNEPRTTHVILPRACGGRIQQIVVLNADSSKPEVDVTCAPPEQPITEPIEDMR